MMAMIFIKPNLATKGCREGKMKMIEMPQVEKIAFIDQQTV